MTHRSIPARYAPTHQAHARMRGFSLVELMVGMAVGLVLIASLSLLFAHTSRSGNELEKSIRQIENGRYAVELLHEDLMLAGFYGEVPADALTMSSPSPCATSATALGWDASIPNAPKAPLPVVGLTDSEASALACLPNRLPGTRAIAVHRLDTDIVAPASISTTDVVYVQTSRCISDPVTSPFVASPDPSALILKEKNCTTLSSARKYVSRIYYIASCNECGVDTVPTLKMAELRGSAMTVVPLAEGIESMVLEYGFDTTDPLDPDPATNASKGLPEVFLTGLSGAVGARDNDWANVVAMRIHLLSRTTERSNGYDDAGKTYALGPISINGDTSGFKRRVYTSTVRIINVAGRRESPPPAPTASS
ncbi:PilW family protein [Simplicispira lacusdiani]|uniref:PilW family protein n=1 Tax=Simplicispira lacusdiani TaxID=2213010 RepID=UPI001E5AFB05|nr:PilW family protein [Simplicispira lacusdiani]